jgi:hypothetical protein
MRIAAVCLVAFASSGAFGSEPDSAQDCIVHPLARCTVARV